MSNEFSQRIGSISSDLAAGKPGQNILAAAEAAWRSPNLELHSRPIDTIRVDHRTITGSELAMYFTKATGSILNTTWPLVFALHGVDPSIMWVATHARSKTQRYALLAGNPNAPDLYVAGGNMIDDKETNVSPFFVPGQMQHLLNAGLSLEEIMENQAAMIEQAVSAAHLREVSKRAPCVGGNALTSESGHTFAALIGGDGV